MFDNTVLVAVVDPDLSCCRAVFFVYTLIAVPQSPATALVDGPPLRRRHADPGVWMVRHDASTVLFLAGFGTYELLQNGAGGGQGPMRRSPCPRAHEHAMRRPGDRAAVGVHVPLPDLRRRRDAAALSCPRTRYVALHVTSLDAIHSFWAYQLGVKADANPGVDNVVYVTTNGPLSVRHPLRGAVRALARLHVRHRPRRRRRAAFASWIKQQQTYFAPVSQVPAAVLDELLPDPDRAG